MAFQKSVVLVNLGTPDRPDKRSIRRYLKAFLSDARVMDISPVLRWMILQLAILPLRPRTILPKYRKLWDGERFLLMGHSEHLIRELSERLGRNYSVRLAMRYGNPSLVDILEEIEQERAEELIVVPLFPQYASATSGSVIEKVLETLRFWPVFPKIRIISQFYDDRGFAEAWRQVAEPYLGLKPDHLLFSFHGLPESHIKKADLSGRCLATPECCSRLAASNGYCYRAQCFQTARAIAELLVISDNQYSIAFQSRLGRTRWLGPSTSETIQRLAASGIRDLLVCCPSFVADCMETVEDIGEVERERFVACGGRTLTLIPSLNSHPAWVEALASLISGKQL